ncbi:TROVE domain-containing protein [Nocardia nova SH22a]|uniref:TROVE domain-containing protein n=1 Tax=Nocardia nova SH22a TaxID=1415166 RepID=W5TNJ0_9NOCA|nr:TROVE domain-containing protein [Nocardia nova]AHH20817.1 TROVE domain-containing protein [Nocardia nova SH22a]
MSKFNTGTTRPVAHGPIRTDTTATGTTFEGAPGYARDAQSELFLLAVTNMVGEDTFYEQASDRDNRFATLVRQVALTDFDWLTRFAHWLRTEANMRSAPIVLAAEAAKARLDAGESGGRDIIKTVLQRADEPGEMLSYWHTHYGRKLPKPVKRGIADAARRLYRERSYLKWDSDTRAIRFADVIQLTHPDPDGAQAIDDLYHYVIGRRIGVEHLSIPDTLATLRANAEFKRRTGEDIDRMAADGSLEQVLADAGMTWEALSAFGAWTAARWEAMIPSMGYMALLRNLRNFDQAGVSDVVAATVAARLSDPDEVARSRQLPMRFLSAYRAAPSLRWSYPLEQALDASLANVPELQGRTLIMIDTSGSMRSAFSKDGTLMRWDAAVVFGLALARRCQTADVVSYSNDGIRFQLEPGESLLRSIERWKTGGYFIGGGTNTAGVTQAAYDRHDRVVILTDEQASGRDPGAVIPKTVPLYTWNLAGHRLGHTGGAPNRHAFGGLSDAAFKMIPLLERGRDAEWPF